MQITYTGSNGRFFAEAFFDSADSLDSVEVTSPRGVITTQVVVENFDTGVVTTLTGSNLLIDFDGDPVQGTVTGMSFSQGGQAQGTVSGISWSILDFVVALDGVEGGNFGPLATLFSSNGPVDIDASAGLGGFDARNLFEDMTNLITQPINFTGSVFGDRYQGAAGDDFVRAGAADGGTGAFGENLISASPGNDTIDFGGGNATTFNFIDYGYYGDPLTFTVNVPGNTAFVSGSGPTDAAFTDTWRNVLAASRDYDGLGFTGGTGNDTINATGVEDGFLQIHGAEGNDTFNITAGGTVRLDFRNGIFGQSSGIVANLGTGAVSDGLGGTDQINHLGGSGRLEIRGTDNDDSVLGSARDDSFIPEQGNDTFNGADGFDQVRYDRSGVGPVNVDLGAGTATGTWDGNAFTDTLIDVEYVRGSRDDNDTLTGDGGDNRLSGRGGDDVLTGFGGNDELFGDPGNDTLFGGTGEDYLEGYDGDDLMLGGAGDDDLRGDAGNDTLRGGDGRDDLRGGDGNDLLDASGGAAATQGWGDYVRPGFGDDTVLGSAALWAEDEGIELSYGDLETGVTITVTDDATGSGSVTGAGNDSFTHVNYFEGSRSGDDSITGSSGAHWEGFAALGGNDTIDGGGGTGDNYVNYRYEAEYFGGAGSGITANLNSGIVTDTQGGTDTLININHIAGSDFADAITAAGLARNTYINGNAGDDSLAGGAADDWIEGGDGRDTLAGGIGNDVLRGDAGNDLAYAGTGDDELHGGDGLDTLYGAADNDTLTGDAGDDLLGGGAGNDSLDGGDGNDALWTTGGDDTGIGGAGDDTIGGAGGNDSLVGEDGNDELWGAFGDDTLSGGTENDTLGGADGNDSLDGGAGADELWGALGADTLRGGTGDDQLGAGPGNDDVDGGAGNDSVYGGLGNDIARGGAGDDAVYGAGGDDWLSGDTGNDTIFAGPGNDTVNYGAGDGADELQFFSLGDDRLALDDALWTGTLTPWQVADTFGAVSGADFVLDFGDGDSVTLAGQAAAAADIWTAIDIF